MAEVWVPTEVFLVSHGKCAQLSPECVNLAPQLVYFGLI